MFNIDFTEKIALIKKNLINLGILNFYAVIKIFNVSNNRHFINKMIIFNYTQNYIKGVKFFL